MVVTVYVLVVSRVDYCLGLLAAVASAPKNYDRQAAPCSQRSRSSRVELEQ